MDGTQAEGFRPDPEVRTNSLRIGAIGAGMIMAECHLAAYAQAGFPVVAIASRTRSRARGVAERYAIAHPDRVTKLVLVSPDGFASPGIEYGRTQNVPPLMRVLPYTLPASMLRGTLQAAYGDPSRMTAATLQRTRDMMLAPGVRQAVIARLGQTVLRDPRPLLRTIAAPTLLLWGTEDAMIPIANAQEYLAALPDAHLVTLPGIGHVPQEEAPGPSLAEVRAFLGG